MPQLYDSRKRILVTGGAGFLGSHLCDRLLGLGHEVLCADNLFTGTKRNIDHLHGEPRFEFLRHDITFPLYIEVDEIYNLACPASPVCRILQASTSEVYGDPRVSPQREDYWGNVNPIGRRSCYDEGKRCAETLFFDYHCKHGLEIKVARIFNTYGPRLHPSDGRVVANFAMQALTGGPITIYGTGNQTRAFCYVDDLIETLIRLMESPADLTGPINLGSPVEITIRELAEAVIAEVGEATKLQELPLPADDPRQRFTDISLARERLDWEPEVEPRDGLKPTVAYFREFLTGG